MWGTGIGCYIIPDEDQVNLHGSKKKTLVKGHGGDDHDDIVRVNPVRMGREKMISYYEDVNGRLKKAQDSKRRIQRTNSGEIIVAGLSASPSVEEEDAVWPANLVRYHLSCIIHSHGVLIPLYLIVRCH